MCGIAGIQLKRGADEHVIDRVLTHFSESIVHRGPNALGVHRHPDRGFLSRRLSIVGIAGGDQPIWNADRSLGIVYNGEVYNYEELRKWCEAKGATFYTRTDTEVVLKLYELQGSAAFARLEGMFAGCIWNENSGEIVLFRDAFGMKPLYVYEDAEKFIFCSELSPLLRLPGVDDALQPEAFEDYLCFRYVNAPLTFLKKIRRLGAGEYVVINGGTAMWHVYEDIADIAPHAPFRSEDEAKEALREAILESVKIHLIGEVPIALLLSGGVDSSILAALLKRLGTTMECFNIGFPTVNEFQYSSEVAQSFDLTMNNVEMREDELIRVMNSMVGQLDEPLADAAQFPLSILCEHIKGKAIVVLSGEGGDELFGGYPQYRSLYDLDGPIAHHERFLKDSFYFPNSDLQNPSLRQETWRRSLKYYTGRHRMLAMSNVDMRTWMSENLMMKADKVMMRHSLEGRFPFLNRGVLRISRALHINQFISADMTTKSLLKQAFKDILPRVIIDRPKMGFTVPTAMVLRQLAPAFAELLFAARGSEVADLIDVPRAQTYLRQFTAGDDAPTIKLWALYVLLQWLANRRLGGLA